MDGADAMAAAFLEETGAAIDQEHRRILHCLSQLSEEQIWQRPAPQANPAGLIVRHLCGNMRQWFLHGVGGAEDVRDRPAEFVDIPRVSRQRLANDLEGLLTEVREVLARVDAPALLQERHIQGEITNVLAAIYKTVTHLEGHAQQIVYITHLFRGREYEPFWKPETVEEGA